MRLRSLVNWRSSAKSTLNMLNIVLPPHVICDYFALFQRLNYIINREAGVDITVVMVNMETLETADNDIGSEEDRIREVWSHNLEEEFKNICRVVQDYP